MNFHRKHSANVANVGKKKKKEKRKFVTADRHSRRPTNNEKFVIKGYSTAKAERLGASGNGLMNL